MISRPSPREFFDRLMAPAHAEVCDTSCPDCLRSYSNLSYHSLLDWRLGVDMAALALDALESAVERRREADRDEDELATRIQALGADRSRLADELDGSLVKSRKLERANREIAERLDAAIGTIRAALGDEKEPDEEEDSDGEDE